MGSCGFKAHYSPRLSYCLLWAQCLQRIVDLPNIERSSKQGDRASPGPSRFHCPSSTTAMSSRMYVVTARLALGVLISTAILLLGLTSTSPGTFWSGILTLFFLLSMPPILSLNLGCLVALQYLETWARSPHCEPVESRVLRWFYWSMLPAFLTWSVTSIALDRWGRRGDTGVKVLCACGAAGVAGSAYVWVVGGFGKDEWAYVLDAPTLWTKRLRWAGVLAGEVWSRILWPKLGEFVGWNGQGN